MRVRVYVCVMCMFMSVFGSFFCCCVLKGKHELCSSSILSHYTLLHDTICFTNFVGAENESAKVSQRETKGKRLRIVCPRHLETTQRTGEEEAHNTEREISGCDLGKLRVNIYFPSLGLSVVTWWIHRPMSSNAHCCYSKTPVPPLVFMVAWLTLWQTSTQYKRKIRYLHCECANTQSQQYTHARTRRQKSTHVAHKRIPLQKGGLSAQFIADCFSLFPLHECICVTTQQISVFVAKV